MRTTIVAAFLIALIQIQAFAGPVVYYSFNGSNTTADVGSSISAFSRQNSDGSALSFPDGTTQNAQPGYLAGVAVSQSHWLGNTNFFQFTMDAAFLQDIVVSYAWQRSSSGPTNAIFQYSSTGIGGLFVDFATNGLPTSFTGAGGVVTQDLSAVSALDGDSTIAFRILGINVGGATGAMRLDNFTIDAIAVPESSTVVLATLGLIALIGARLRRR